MKNEHKPREYNVLWALAGGYLFYLGAELYYGMLWGGERDHIALSVLAGAAFMGVGGMLLLREWRLYRGTKQESGEELPEEAVSVDKEPDDADTADKETAARSGEILQEEVP